jgi:hypothetical protein
MTVSSAETIVAFNTGFEPVNLHRPTPYFIAIPARLSSDVTLCERNIESPPPSCAPLELPAHRAFTSFLTFSLQLDYTRKVISRLSLC